MKLTDLDSRLRLIGGAMAAASLLFLAACDNEKDVDPPAELVDIQPKIEVRRLWSKGLGGDEHLRLGLRPATDLTKLYAASHGGEVYALDLEKGSEHWRTRTRLRLSGGPGVGGGYVVVGSTEGDVVALSAGDGKERWRVRVGGEVLAPPAVNENVVVVRTVDGRLHGLNAKDGSELWLNEQNVPRLTLRGTAPPVIVGDAVITGFDNGKVVAITLSSGEVLWEQQIARSQGRTELDRLVDIDSSVHVSGNDVYVVGFQSRVAMVALDSGQPWWQQDVSSDRGMGVSPEYLIISGANGDVQARRRRDGSQVWEQKALHRRGLSGPAVEGDVAVVGDYQGYLHWLDVNSGEILARTKTDGERISNAPVVVGNIVYVQTDGGQLSAWRRVVKE